MNYLLRRGFFSPRFALHSRIQRRLFSEEAAAAKAAQPEANSYRTFAWLAGMGGFLGAAIYFIGAPEKAEDKNVCTSEQRQ
jgi:hypothetical protein